MEDAGGALEIAYDQRAQSEGVRLGKSGRVLGMAVDPMTERNACVVVSDGRVIFVDLLADDVEDGEGKKKKKKPRLPRTCLEDLLPPSSFSSPSFAASPSPPPLRLFTSGLLSGLAAPPFVVRMCPPLTMKNISEYAPLLAVGAASGNVQVLNASSGRVEREFAVHTFPVRGIEWTSLHSLLSHAHQVN